MQLSRKSLFQQRGITPTISKNRMTLSLQKLSRIILGAGMSGMLCMENQPALSGARNTTEDLVRLCLSNLFRNLI